MTFKKIHNAETAHFSWAVKEWARLRGTSPNIIHNYLKERFGYKSYGWLWKRKPIVLKFVLDGIAKDESKIYS